MFCTSCDFVHHVTLYSCDFVHHAIHRLTITNRKLGVICWLFAWTHTRPTWGIPCKYVGLARTIYIRCIYIVLAGKSPNIQSYTVYIHGFGQTYKYVAMHTAQPPLTNHLNKGASHLGLHAWFSNCVHYLLVTRRILEHHPHSRPSSIEPISSID